MAPRSSSFPTALPTSSALLRGLIRIYAVTGVLTVLVGGVFFAVGFDFNARQALIGMGVIAPLALIPMLAMDLWVLTRHYQPIALFLKQLHSATTPPPAELSQAAYVRAFNLPSFTFLRVLFVHIPSFGIPTTLLFIIANSFFELGINEWQFVMFWLVIGMLGVGHAIFEHFAVTAVFRPLLPLFRAQVGELTPAVRKKIWLISIRRKLLLVSVFVVFVPLLVLSASMIAQLNGHLRAEQIAETQSLRISQPLQIWAGVLVIASTAVTWVMSILMARDITQSVETLMGAMQRVAGGDLDAQLAVTTSDEFADLFRGFNRMTDGLQERERLRDAFGRYVAPELAEQVMKGGVQLGGQTVVATVLFADIRGFTTISEKLTSEQTVSLLNSYFAAVEPVIQSEGGWINKFGGDSLLAVFGVPMVHADHALRAVQAALRIRAALKVFNAQRASDGLPAIAIGMGVHSGPMVVGNVGSPTRMEYTVIGDIVNVASRIDGLNKEWNTDILVSTEAYEAAGGRFPARAMPPVAVKGKSLPITVYALE